MRDREAVEAGKSDVADLQNVAHVGWPLTGVHPEFVMLNDLIEKRRTSKLDLASKALYHVEEEYDREFAAEERTIWSNWAVSGLLRLLVRELTMLTPDYRKRRPICDSLSYIRSIDKEGRLSRKGG